MKALFRLFVIHFCHLMLEFIQVFSEWLEQVCQIFGADFVEAFRFLLEYLGLNREGLAAFGDGDNDKELLAYARIGIAMENASPECKRAADWIAPSNDRDGVAWGIEKILRQELPEL